MPAVAAVTAPAVPVTPTPVAVARSGLLPPQAKAPTANTMTAGPRVSGPSTQPRPPLPPKPKA